MSPRQERRIWRRAWRRFRRDGLRRNEDLTTHTGRVLDKRTEPYTLAVLASVQKIDLAFGFFGCGP